MKKIETERRNSARGRQRGRKESRRGGRRKKTRGIKRAGTKIALEKWRLKKTPKRSANGILSNSIRQWKTESRS